MLRNLETCLDRFEQALVDNAATPHLRLAAQVFRDAVAAMLIDLQNQCYCARRAGYEEGRREERAEQMLRYLRPSVN